MKIFLDNIVFNFQAIGGISVYITQLISRLLANGQDLSLVEQRRAGANALRRELNVSAATIIKEQHLPVRLLSYAPIRIKPREPSIVHSSYYRWCASPLAANIITVYDFNYELGFVRSGFRKFLHCHQKERAIKRADGIICISESTKRDLLRLFRDINPDRIAVTHLAAGTEFFRYNATETRSAHLSSRFSAIAGKQYILYVGSRIFHKNFNICVDTLRELPEYQLIIVGSELTPDEATMLESRLPSRYQAFSNVTAAELNLLYNNAFCFMYPSSYEGFGIPILEAMQAGCPVVTTNVSSIPEVCGDAALKADSIAPDRFAGLIRSLEHPPFRARRINDGLEQAKKFSWNRTYEETNSFYHLVFTKKFDR